MRKTGSSLRSLCLVLFVSLLGISSVSLALPRSGGPSECAATQQWIQAHQGELPSTLRELDRYPMPQRMAIVAALKPEVRSRVWREHFKRLLVQGGAELTGAQREVLEEAMEVMTPELFAGTADDPLVKIRLESDLPRLMERAVEAFGAPRALKTFTGVGTVPDPDPVDGVRCNCATHPGDTCGSGRYCDDTEVCTGSRTGCGPGGVYVCNGMCVNNTPDPGDPTDPPTGSAN